MAAVVCRGEEVERTVVHPRPNANVKENAQTPKDAKLPKAGEITVYDFRRDRDDAHYFNGGCKVPVTLKCVQWNIERGYRLDDVIRVLKSHRADIVCLQELDIGCERSGGRNCALELAQALEMKCAFLTEFEEVWSPHRSKSLQGGGVHGNAILSRFALEARVVPHTHHPVDWERSGHRMGEPRRGKRAILAAEIYVPGITSPIVCYSLHLEIFSGIFGRIKQFSDVLEEARKTKAARPYQMVFGDLNTMAHGIARFCPLYCQDPLRFGSWGYSEATWWQRNILSSVDDGSDVANEGLARFVPACLTEAEALALRNPHFFDPFSPTKDTTLQDRWGIYKGKLDWTLLRGWHVLAKGMDNHGYRWSDHKLMYVVVRPAEGTEGDPGVIAHAEQHIPLDGRAAPWRAVLYSTLGLAVVVAGSAYAVGRLART